MVIVTGSLGSGKTRCIQKLVSEIKEGKGWHEADVSYMDTVEEEDKSKIIIVWEDCCGKYGTNPIGWKETRDKLLNLVKWVEKSKNRKVLTSMRVLEYTYLQGHIDKKEDEDKLGLKAISLNNFPYEIDSMEVPQHCCEDDSCTEIKDRSKKFNSIGEPGISLLLSIPDISRDKETFEDDPIRSILQVFESMSTDTGKREIYRTLVCVLLRNGNLNMVTKKDIRSLEVIWFDLTSDYLQASESEKEGEELRKINEKLETNANSVPDYLKKNKATSLYTFTHELFFLCLFYHYFKSNPLHVIEFCDIWILMELLRPTGYDFQVYEQELYRLFSVRGEIDENKDIATTNSSSDLSKENAKKSTINKISESCVLSNKWAFEVQDHPKHYEAMIKRILGENIEVENHPLLKNKEFREMHQKMKLETSSE